MKYMGYEIWVCPSVRQSIGLSVCPSFLKLSLTVNGSGHHSSISPSLYIQNHSYILPHSPQFPIFLQYGKTERDRNALKARCHSFCLRAPILSQEPSSEEMKLLHQQYRIPVSDGPVPFIILPGFKVHPYSMLELWMQTFGCIHENPPGIGPHEILQRSRFLYPMAKSL